MKLTNLFVCCVVSILLVLSSACSHADRHAASGSSARPNVLFIAVDDMNDWVGFLGGNRPIDVKTPNLDRLAQSSLVFTNAHTPAPACAPARTSIMTGVHPAVVGPENVFWGDGPRWRDFDAIKRVETLERSFKNRGYTTLGGGKIYHSQAPPWAPTSQVEPESWDFYYPSPYISHPYQNPAARGCHLPGRGRQRASPGRDAGILDLGADRRPGQQDGGLPCHGLGVLRIETEARQTVLPGGRHLEAARPVGSAPEVLRHVPLESIVLPEVKEDDLEDASDHGRRAIHRWVLRNEQWKKIVQSYAASMTFADAMVGRLLDTLERSEYAGNTIVVLWSDHGMHMGEKENFEKFTLWDRSTHVPFLIKAPGVTQPGTRTGQPVSLMDIYPTLAELAGFDVPPHVDGTSLVPLMKNPAATHGPVVTSYRMAANPAWHLGPAFEPQVGHAVRSMNYRYIYYPGSGLEELYDHQAESSEWDNVAYKQKVRRGGPGTPAVPVEGGPEAHLSEGNAQGIRGERRRHRPS